MGYYDFPHTRNYDTDLGYIIKRYFELNTDFESLEKNFNDLKAWCIAQLNSEALKTLVANKLDEWLQDGTLEALINNPLNHVTTYDTVVEMLPHSGLLEGSKIYCTGADSVNDGKGGHFRIRARLSTDVIDNYKLYLIDGGVKVAERINAQDSIIFTVEDTQTLTELNNNLDLYDKVILVVKSNIIVSDNDTLSNKIIKIIGAGGIFTTDDTKQIVLNVPNLTIESTVQLFNKNIVVKADSLLETEVTPILWGAYGDINTDVTTELNSLFNSSFKYIRMLKGVYVGGFTNNISGRTITFDDGCINDGILHIAYGSERGSSDKWWCKNTNVIGKCVATIRVGGAQIDGLYMPDGIEILELNSIYPKQTELGYTAGVHWHFGCKNIYIGDIKTGNIVARNDNVRNYALGIDAEDGEEKPNNIYINKLTFGNNLQPNYSSVLLNYTHDIEINNIIAGENHSNSGNLQVRNTDHLRLNYYNGLTKSPASGNGCCHILLEELTNNCYLGTIIGKDVANTGAFGITLVDVNNINVNSWYGKNQLQGIRIVNGHNVVFTSFINESNTTPIAEAGTNTYGILKQFNI